MITIRYVTEPEDESPEQAEQRAGYAEGFAKCTRQMMATATGRWGWCCIRCEAIIKLGREEYKGTAYLGGCSYLSERDFIRTSGYAQDLADEAVKEAFEEFKRIEEERVGNTNDGTTVLR